MENNLKEPENKFSLFSNKLVVVKIVIDTEGRVVFAEIDKSINEHYNQSALELVKKMPVWKPAKQNKKPVMCYVTIPFIFVNGY